MNKSQNLHKQAQSKTMDAQMNYQHIPTNKFKHPNKIVKSSNLHKNGSKKVNPNIMIEEHPSSDGDLENRKEGYNTQKQFESNDSYAETGKEVLKKQ